ncbi:TetR/AcrR family transcriptional regulator [Geitlerinema sp. CS-897]|nr:TetR/AcrR family transcriptional regulator [Geitlerinema sp. CS-897]
MSPKVRHLSRTMPKIVDREEYRKEILLESFELFARKGYEAVTMREIATTAGVTTGTLYHYFPNKKSLFEQLVELLCEEDLAIYRNSLGSDTSIDDRIARAFDVVEQNEDFYLKILFVIVDFYRQQKNEGVANDDAIATIAARWQAECAELTGIRDRRLLSFIMCFFNGLLLERMFEGHTLSYSEQYELFREMFVSYLDSHPNTIKNDKKS